MNPIVEKATLGTQEITFETGAIARQASGAILVRCAETVVLVTVVAAKKAKTEASFFPLTVEYRENAFASGRIPGGFFKREGRPAEKEILTSRVIDRPVRPLFPDGFLHETQIMIQPLSADPACDPDMLAITGASAALMVSDIPWAGPIAGIRIARIQGEFVANPAASLLEGADINLVLAASRDAIVMVEGEAHEIPEAIIVDALLFGHQALQPLLDAQERLAKRAGKEKMPFTPPVRDQAVEEQITASFGAALRSAYQIQEKQLRNGTLSKIRDEIQAFFLAQVGGDAALLAKKQKDIDAAHEEVSRKIVRGRILDEGIRIDGRDTKTIRPISIDVGWLPRVHGSALFTRGETQASATATLGTVDDEQRIETLLGSYQKRFLLHYNFPPYSTGETKPIRGPGRREIGHGFLAERSLEQVLPSRDAFPYTIRVVSDITESNGSSSMASVCGGSLALMDAGVPIRRPVAGVAMGLIKEGDRFAILSDILGDEDHLGDMDFKVTGTREGICAIQMDIKIDGLSRELLTQALEQAHAGRLHILEKMDATLPRPRADLSPYAPRIVTVWVKPDRIRDVIGPGGKIIRGLSEQTGVAINIDDTGRVTLASPNEAACQRAIDLIKSLTRDVEPGQIFLGTVKAIKDFGAFVELVPGREGLLHISHIHSEHLERVTDILQEGDEVLVKVLEIDPQGRIRLSRKDALEEQAAQLSRSATGTPKPVEGAPPSEGALPPEPVSLDEPTPLL